MMLWLANSRALMKMVIKTNGYEVVCQSLLIDDK